MSAPKRLIDAVPNAERKRPMKVLCLGFSRTGTMSLKVALEKLGYSVYHMSECCMRARERHPLLWEEAVKAKLLGEGKPWSGEDIEKVLCNYDAIEDIPCILFIDELLEQYPDAKVLLTNRDIDSWYTSVHSSIFKVLELRLLPLMTYIDPLFWRPYYSMLNMISDKWTDGDKSNGGALRKTYIDHYAYVRSKVPKERLLEFESKDGWKPLCEFLGNEVPTDMPYPRVNDAKFTVRIHQFLIVLRIWRITRKYMGAFGVLGLAMWLGSWSMQK